jgi:23S rRNA (uracil1939-C5)-methyltransferase
MREVGCVEACRACPHRDYSREESYQKKIQWLQKELPEENISPIIGAKERWRYRKKVTLHAKWNNAWNFGTVYFLDREEHFVAIPNCPLHTTQINSLLSLLIDLPKEIPLKYVLINEVCATLVLKCKEEIGWLKLLNEKRNLFPKGVSLFVNWNPVAGKRTLNSKQTKKIFGEDWNLSGGSYFGATGFRQQIDELQSIAQEMAAHFFSESQMIVDFYCGKGDGLKRWQLLCEKPLGVEISGESLITAKLNAPGAVVIRGKVEDRLPQVDEYLQGRPFHLYTNPSRAGHNQKVLDWIESKGPEKIAYLSCHPRSLSGDLANLRSYNICKIQPFDFFPQTDQVETLVLLQRKTGK